MSALLGPAAEVGVLCAVFAIAGTMLHEASHGAVALATGRLIGFNVRAWEVYYKGYLPPGKVEYAIAGAPIAGGILLAPVLLHIGAGLPAWVGWGVYTIGGVVPLPGIGKGIDFQFQEAGG